MLLCRLFMPEEEEAPAMHWDYTQLQQRHFQMLSCKAAIGLCSFCIHAVSCF